MSKKSSSRKSLQPPKNFWEEMQRMQERVDTLFDRIFSKGFFSRLSEPLLPASLGKEKSLMLSSYKHPLSDVWETEKNVVATLEMPGVNKQDIQVHVDNSTLEIKAETKSDVKHDDAKHGMHRRERNYAGFYRRFSLPRSVDAEKASAAYTDGVLTITLPKLKTEAHKKRLLPVQ